jgi:enolase-phosphatase E1
MRTDGLLLDIEGTTTPVEFVTETLFPYARARFPAFLEAAAEEPAVRADLAALRAEHGREAGPETPPAWRGEDRKAALAYLSWLMDRDRKSTALKALQGRVWARGFQEGRLVAPVYADVAPALRRWHAEGREACIFSSGSVAAQRLLFAHSTAGDLSPLLAAFFDTTTGPKREAASYRRIAAARGRAPEAGLLLYDVPEELEAAAGAGMQVALVVRPPRSAPAGVSHAVVASFDGLPEGLG